MKKSVPATMIFTRGCVGSMNPTRPPNISREKWLTEQLGEILKDDSLSWNIVLNLKKHQHEHELMKLKGMWI